MSYNLTDTLLILKEKMRCNRCLIDGAYQDGEECDAINMCWKYWSHDAWRMDGGMMVKADGQVRHEELREQEARYIKCNSAMSTAIPLPTQHTTVM